jgi:peptide chain release factor 2
MGVDLIASADLSVTYYDPRPPGGQRVGIVSGVKVEHLPTGTIAIVQINRSQHRNKEIAVRMIEAALTDPAFRG